MKDTPTPAAKLYNWGLISKALEVCGIKLGIDEKSLIVAGDQQMLSELLKQMKDADLPEQPTEDEVSKAKATQQLSQPTGKRGKGKTVQSILQLALHFIYRASSY